MLLALLPAASHLVWQVLTLNPDDPDNPLARFRSNRFAGLLVARDGDAVGAVPVAVVFGEGGALLAGAAVLGVALQVNGDINLQIAQPLGDVPVRQVAYILEMFKRALQALTGDNHRRRAERIGGGHTRHPRAFGAAHHHYIFAPWALDASRGNAQFKTGNRMQGRQRTKTNSHVVSSLSKN